MMHLIVENSISTCYDCDSTALNKTRMSSSPPCVLLNKLKLISMSEDLLATHKLLVFSSPI